MAQGGQNPDGFFARSQLGADVNALLSRLEFQSITLGDTEKAAISATDAVMGTFFVHDTTNDTSGVYALQGDGNAATNVSAAGGTYGTSEGTDASINVYWDAGNSRYEIENQTGGEATFEVIAVRVP